MGPFSFSAGLIAISRRRLQWGGQTLGIAGEQTICTGDLTAYCGDPAATIDLVRASGIAVVMGNCDAQLALGADDCGCGFTPRQCLSAVVFELVFLCQRPGRR